MEMLCEPPDLLRDLTMTNQDARLREYWVDKQASKQFRVSKENIVFLLVPFYFQYTTSIQPTEMRICHWRSDGRFIIAGRLV